MNTCEKPIRQYIGARYVPKFYSGINGNQWDENTEYEALTIVTYLNDSYTSRVPVPSGVGNPKENPEYWVLTGNYNAQIAEYSEQLSLIQNKFSNTNRKFILIGDSYATSTHSGGWISKLIDKKQLTYGINLWSSAINGVGFAKVVDGKRYAEMLNTIVSGLSESEKKSITDVVVQGSINDWASDETNIRTGIKDVEDIVKNNLPNATLYIPLVGWTYETNEIRNGVARAYNIYFYGSTFSVVVDKLYKVLLDPYYMEENGSHPNDAGMELIAGNINSMLNGGTKFFNEHDELKANFTMLNGNVISFRGNIQDYGYNIFNTENNGTRFDSSPISISNLNGTLIGTLDYGETNNLFMNDCKMVVPVLLALEGNVYFTHRCLLRVTRNKTLRRWEMTLWSYDMYNGNYEVNNIVGAYFAFNVFVDMFSN